MDGKVIKEESVSSPCSSSPLTNIVASGKENRRVGSPLNTSSEILTRSRSKGLSKENSHPHSRMSESPKVREGSSGSGHQSPPASNIRSHSSHSQGHGHSFGHAFSSPHSTSAIGNGMTSGSVTGGGTPSPPVNGSASTPNANSSGSSGRTPSSSNSSGSSGGSGSSGSVHGSEGLGHGSGGRYVVKIKRFLGTLLHFGCDISPEVGDRVRSLVFNLVSGHLSIEEFHHSLQEVTSFPLRPFVLPFLRAHLPLLQREISHLARLAKQSPISYIRSHEQVIFEAGSSPGEPCDIFHSEAADIGLARKRKASESYYENGESGDSGYISTPKRHHASIFSPPFFITSSSSGTTGGGGGGGSSGGNTGGGSTAGSSAADFRDYYPSAYPLLSSIHHAHGHSLHESGTSSGSSGLTPPNHTPGSSNGSILGKGATGPEEEWKNIHVMLNCILSMVEKTKRALAILQNRTFHAEGVEGGGRGGSSSADGGANTGASPSWLRRPHSAFAQMENSSEDFKRQASEMIAQALRATEDRVAEVKRRAEEAVQEVKRQALVELQRAEARACEVVAAERARLERVLLDSRRNPTESVIVGASLDSETCWNCGRKAHETCSGCNMARYCSAFCQHKDWENHHSACGRSNSSSGTSERATGSGATGRESGSGGGGSDSKNPHIIHENSNSSPINVSQPSPDNHSSGSNN